MFRHFLHDLEKIDAGEKIPPRDITDDLNLFTIDHLDSIRSPRRYSGSSVSGIDG